MPEYIRRKIPGASYFFTATLQNRRQKFLTDHIDVLRQAFTLVRKRHPFTIDAIVILPEHLRTILTLPPGDTDYATRWRQIKSHFSRSIQAMATQNLSKQSKGERGIWQRRYWEHTIRDEEDFRHHVEYIHYNPVKHGYTEKPIDWQFSSFRKYVENGTYPAHWCTCDVSVDGGE